MTTEYEPLLLLLELLVLQRMSSPLLCHDHPTTSLLKEGPGLYQLTPDTAPGLAFLDPQQEVFLGLDNCKINTAPHPSQGTTASRWSEPPLRWHSAPHTCPTLWHNDQPTFVINENSISQDHPVTWELTDSLSLQLCGVDSPAQLPTAHSALQSSTAFKQEPHRPPVNHLAHPPHPQHDGLRTAHTFST